MNFEEIERAYMSAPEIAEQAGVDIKTVHNWLKYHRYMKFEYLLGKPLVERAEFEKFKKEHPELIKRETAQAA